jgi:hypothetical protein
MSTSPPIPIPIAITPVAISAVAIPVAVPVTIPFTVPVLSAIEQQEQCECIGQTSLLEKWLIIIQQLIVINEGQLRSFDKAAVRVDAAGIHSHHTAECMASLTEAKFICYLGRPPSVPGNKKSGGTTLDNPHFTTWLHLSMLIDFETLLINQACKPRGAIYGEIIDINSLPICRPLECDLRAGCATLERKLLPPDHPANNELAYNLKLKKLYYKSIGGITEGSATLFKMHNSALKLIGDHIALLNAEVYCITSQIASLHEHERMGYIMVDKIW